MADRDPARPEQVVGWGLSGSTSSQVPKVWKPVPDPRDGVLGREPDAGECRFCGCVPAAQVDMQSMSSVLVFFTIRTCSGWMCRSCAEVARADADARTMAWGWWGFGAIAIWMLPLVNRVRIRRMRLLDIPRPTPGVVAQRGLSSSTPTPWFRRRGPLIAAGVGGAIWFPVVGVVLAGMTGLLG